LYYKSHHVVYVDITDMNIHWISLLCDSWPTQYSAGLCAKIGAKFQLFTNETL